MTSLSQKQTSSIMKSIISLYLLKNDRGAEKSPSQVNTAIFNRFYNDQKI